MTPTAHAAKHRSVLIGLIGEGVGPSLTPAMHELEGARHGLSYVYRTVNMEPGEAEPARLQALLDSARRLGFNGLNVTHPAKQAIVPLLDELAPSAASIEAVNTVVLTGDRAVGHNTDVTAFAASIDEARDGRVLGTTVLVGAGGAGAAVARAIAERQPTRFVVADLDAGRAEALASATGAESASAQELAHLIPAADTVINATPLGMAAHPGSAVDPALLRAGTLVVDIVYRPVETAFVRGARSRGCSVVTGLGMAMNQAADAFEIFTGEPADRAAMLADLTDLVAAEATRNPAHVAPLKGQER
ncbi:shikimate dehydrogenase [uncultured Demequina sp.]|uniref:shikimate dehydrogenase n=1 Tax=uncultured Demequina sp. TaxID=693499 RepID=UPI0025D74773|nr:shikimate dehydrogenase [uncultured Demequina sp.]